MICVECKKEIVKNVGTLENPMCEQCYEKMKAEYESGISGGSSVPRIKPGIDPFMLLGFLICIGSTIMMFFVNEYGQFLGILCAVFSLICLIGLVVSAVDSSNAGPILVIIGCVFFIPIGLAGVFGAQRAMREKKKRQMEFSRSVS